MIKCKEGITASLISGTDVRQNVASIFADYIVVDQHFTVVAAGKNVLDILGYSFDDLKNRDINYLTDNENLVFGLKKELQSGSFLRFQTRICTKNKTEISVSISGFYLGLISSVNEYIVLKIENNDEVELVNQKLQQKKIELDNFIYRASHDLRGPLATIKGLVNLLKMRENNDELDRIVSLLDAHANKLDERLYKLVHLAQADLEQTTPTYTVNFNDIETALRRLIEQNAFVDFLELHYTAPMSKLNGLNEVLLQSMLNNLLLHILSLPLLHLGSQVHIHFDFLNNYLEINIVAEGFEISDPLSDMIRADESIYTEIVNHPQLLNFYSAQKIAWKLNARMSVQFLSAERHCILVYVPIAGAA
jgi:signal transduction histidine kinase